MATLGSWVLKITDVLALLAVVSGTIPVGTVCSKVTVGSSKVTKAPLPQAVAGLGA